MRFDSYHPLIDLLWFAAAFACVCAFRHPVCLAIAWCAVFAWSVQLRGVRGLIFDLALLPLAALYACIYASYNHFGITDLRTNFIGNQITLESMVYGGMLGITAATVLMLVSCLLVVVSADKVIYLLGRLFPKLSLFVSILLRFIPRIGERGRRIRIGRCGIGKSPGQGGIPGRLHNSLAFLSILITWTLEELVESSSSMKSRGYSLPGRTAFSIYRFDNRDRGVVLVIAALLAMTGMGAAFDQMRMYFNPEIVFNTVTPLSVLFYIVYSVFLLLPFLLQLLCEEEFRRGRKALLAEKA